MITPKISIISVNFNDGVGLTKTIESLEKQVWLFDNSIEHIIVDGGSTDNSVELIKNYVQREHNYKIVWTSEKDRGIYDGMNKGIQMSRGEYLYFLNGGDVLNNRNSLKDILNIIDGSDIIVGRVNYVCDGRIVGESEKLSERDLRLYYMYLYGICHQAALIKRNLLEKYPYDINAKINADWKFFVQTIVLNNASVRFSEVIFANFDRSGLSSRNLDKLLIERREILESLIPKRISTDYLEICPYYYEVIRVSWLLKHPFFYKLYKTITTFGSKLFGYD